MYISKSSLAVLPHDCVIKLFSIYDTLKSAEKKAADLLISDPRFIMTANISEAAFRAGCSEPTFLRLAKKLNYTGYTDLKHHLGTNTAPQSLLYNNSITKSDSPENIVKKVFDMAIQGLEDTFRMLDVASIKNAAEAICNALIELFSNTETYKVYEELSLKRFLCFEPEFIKKELASLLEEEK